MCLELAELTVKSSPLRRPQAQALQYVGRHSHRFITSHRFDATCSDAALPLSMRLLAVHARRRRCRSIEASRRRSNSGSRLRAVG